MVYNQVFQQNA